jgi:hypothetical protein
VDFKIRNNIADFEVLHLERHSLFRLRHVRTSLSRNSLAFFISFGFKLVILFNSIDEGQSAITFSNVFRSNVDSLFDFSLLNLLVEDKTEGSWVDIENFGSSSVVEMMRHAFVDGSVYDDIDVVSLSMGL